MISPLTTQAESDEQRRMSISHKEEDEEEELARQVAHMQQELRDVHQGNRSLHSLHKDEVSSTGQQSFLSTSGWIHFSQARLCSDTFGVKSYTKTQRNGRGTSGTPFEG